MMKTNILDEIKALRKHSRIAYIGSINEDGFPQVKGMFVLEHERLQTHYFSTNLGSKRARQFLENPRACVYYCDEGQMKGALFTGRMEVCTDRETKAFLWRPGFEMYYPDGIDDADYCVLQFTAEKVNYYHGLYNETIDINES